MLYIISIICLLSSYIYLKMGSGQSTDNQYTDTDIRPIWEIYQTRNFVNNIIFDYLFNIIIIIIAFNDVLTAGRRLLRNFSETS